MTPTLLSGKDRDCEGPVYQVWAGDIWASLARETRTVRALHVQGHSPPGHLSVTFRVVGATGAWHNSALQTSGGQQASSSGTGSTAHRQMSRLKPRAEQTRPGA